MSFKQCVVMPMVKPAEMGVGEFLDGLVKIGFGGIEVWDYAGEGWDFTESFEEVAEACLSRGLKVASMVGHSHVCAETGTHAEGFSRRANHERLEAELRESIDLAAKYDIPGVITLSGHRNMGESDYEGMLVCAEGLRKIAPYAEEKGVNLNMELLNTTVDHPHYLCDSTDWAMALCELVGSERCKILYDVYHMQIMEGDLVRSMARLGKWIGHVHTAGVPGRQNLDEVQEINYRGVCAGLRKIGYAGWVGHEFMPKLEAGDEQAVWGALKEAYEVCS